MLVGRLGVVVRSGRIRWTTTSTARFDAEVDIIMLLVVVVVVIITIMIPIPILIMRYNTIMHIYHTLYYNRSTGPRTCASTSC